MTKVEFTVQGFGKRQASFCRHGVHFQGSPWSPLRVSPRRAAELVPHHYAVYSTPSRGRSLEVLDFLARHQISIEVASALRSLPLEQQLEIVAADLPPGPPDGDALHRRGGTDGHVDSLDGQARRCLKLA